MMNRVGKNYKYDCRETPMLDRLFGGQVGNDALDTNRIRGWRIELNIDSQADTKEESSGIIMFDQLSCVRVVKICSVLPFRKKDAVLMILAAMSTTATSTRVISTGRFEINYVAKM
jgi:hypothetical protein